MPNAAIDAWKLAKATVVSSALDWSSPHYDNYGSVGVPSYKITFEYTAGETSYCGEYTTGTPQEEGLQFEILYDSADPRRNTLSTPPSPWWVRVLVWAAAASLVWLAIRYLPSEY